MSLNVNLLAAPGIMLLTDMIIRANTGGDKGKEAARAADITAIVTAVQAVEGGDVASGLSDLQAALNPANLTPGEALALQSFISSLSVQLAPLQLAAGTLLGQAQAAIFNSIAVAVLQVCAGYKAA